MAQALADRDAAYGQAVNTPADPNLTPQAALQSRADAIAAADAAFSQAAEQATQWIAAQPTDSPGRAEALAALTPSDADAVATVRHEQERVRRLVDQGQRLEKIIETAPRARLAAIIDNLGETLPEEASADGPAILDEYRALAWDRLVALGDPVAVEVHQREQAAELPQARLAILTQAKAGDISMVARGRLFTADRTAYDVAFGSASNDSAKVAKEVGRIRTDAARFAGREN